MKKIKNVTQEEYNELLNIFLTTDIKNLTKFTKEEFKVIIESFLPEPIYINSLFGLLNSFIEMEEYEKCSVIKEWMNENVIQ